MLPGRPDGHLMVGAVHGVAGPMILLGDICHNATDGLVVAASFLSSIPIGIAVSLSVIAHEIPQEVGDFAILLHSNYSKKRALTLNLLSSLSTVPAAMLATTLWMLCEWLFPTLWPSPRPVFSTLP